MNEHFARSGQRLHERIGREKVVGIGRVYDGVGLASGFRHPGKVGKCSEERLNPPQRQLRCLVGLPHQAHDGVPGVNERSRDRAPYVAACPRHEDTHGIPGPFFMQRFRRGYWPYSALMLASRITLAHFAVSFPIRVANSAGVIGTSTSPKSASCAFSLASPRPALISLLSLSMTPVGVSFGAPMPNQRLTS